MIQFDALAKTLTLSVHDLLGPAMSLDREDGLMGITRAQIGSELHAEHLAAEVAAAAAAGTPEAFRPEVTVSWTGERRGWTITVRGRADGVRRGAAGVSVTELKTTMLPGGMLAELGLERAHAEQCALYGLMLATAGERVTHGEVVYISTADRTTKRFEVIHDVDAVSALLEKRLARMLDAYLEDLRLAAARAELATRLRFPFAQPNTGQAIMLDEVAGVMESGLHLLCSAPTGIGKTVAALLPALRQTLATNGTLFFVTSKVSQQTLALSTLRELLVDDTGMNAQQAGGGGGEGAIALGKAAGPPDATPTAINPPPRKAVCVLQLAARDRVCLHDEPGCAGGKCPLREDFNRRLEQSDLLARLTAGGIVDSDTLTLAARAERLCPHWVQRALCQRASVIVADLNYVFSPQVALREYFDQPTYRNCRLVVDEAHNLPQRAAEYYSPVLDVAACRRYATLAHRAGPRIYTAAADLLDAITVQYDATVKELAEAREGLAGPYVGEPNRQFYEEILGRVEVLIYRYNRHLILGGDRPPAFAPAPWRDSKRLFDPLLALLYEIQLFGWVCELESDLFVGIWSPPDTLKILCLDAAPYLRQRLVGFGGSVLMSATLTPLDFFARQFGLEGPDTLRLDLPSPFPREHRLLVAAIGIDTTYHERVEEAPAIAALMARTMAHRPGNYLAYFSSFAFRDQVLAKLPREAAMVIRQTPGMDARIVLAMLRRNKGGTCLLAAVMGGTLSEGVDFGGMLAIGAFVIGPGLPPVDVERELVREYMEMKFQAGWDYAYICPGLNKVVQAGGRVIRSPEDVGFIMLMGRRFERDEYFGRLPEFWRTELLMAEDPAPLVADFWSGYPTSDAGH